MISVSRSVPDEWMVLANSICLALRLPSAFLESWSERISRLLSGVRSSCDMLARNSDLYFEVSASCLAFSSSAWRACSTSWFLRSTSAFCSASSPAFSSSCWLVWCSSSCWLCSSRASDCDCLSRSSVRLLASMVLSTMPMLSVSWSRKAWWVVLKRSNDASSSTALTCPSKSTGRTMTFAGGALAQAGGDLDVVGRHVGQQDLLLLERALADQPFAELEAIRHRLALAVRVAGEQLELRLLAAGVEDVEDAVLGGHHRRELGEDHAADRQQVLLALQHAAELGEVGLQPVLLGVLLRRVLQVADHLVDVVLQRRDLAARLDRDRARQVAVGHRGGDLGDGAHLGGQVGGQLVDVVGEILPGAGGARHAGLAAELALDADLAGHGGDLVGEGGQGVDHAVDGVGQRGDLALRLHGQLLLQVAVGDGGDDLGDAAHLAGEVAGHRVDVVGEILPGARRRPSPRPGRRACPRCRPRAPRASPRRRTS